MEWEQRRRSLLWSAIDGSVLGEDGATRRRVARRQRDSGIRTGGFAGLHGPSDQAVPLYRRALELVLPARRRRRAVIQLASSLRNLGQAPEGIALLTAEHDAGLDELDDAVQAFLAVALADSGREREAVSVALTALSRHHRRYRRSLANYAQSLGKPARRVIVDDLG